MIQGVSVNAGRNYSISMLHLKPSSTENPLARPVNLTQDDAKVVRDHVCVDVYHFYALKSLVRKVQSLFMD